MIKHTKSSRVLSGLVLGSLVIGLISAPVSDAAKKAALKTKKITLTVGQKKQIQQKSLGIRFQKGCRSGKKSGKC